MWTAYFFFGSDDPRLTDIQDQLNARFQMTKFGETSHYLDMDVCWSWNGNFSPADNLSQENTGALSDGRLQAGIGSHEPRSGQLSSINKLTEPQLSGINLQMVLLCGPPYIPDPTSPIQWEFLVGIVQIPAPFIAIW